MEGNLAPKRELDSPGMKRRHVNWPRLIYYVVLLVTVYIILAPMVMLIYSSVGSKNGKMPFEELTFTWSNYLYVLADPLTYKLLYNTVLFTVGSIALGMSVAICLAWLLQRANLPLKTLLYALIMIPMAIPSMIYAIAWTQLLGTKTGFVNVILQKLFGFETGPFDVFTLGGMIFVQGIAMVPTAFLMIAATFTTLDPSLEEQSAICGRGMFWTIRRITLPILKPSLLSAIIFFTIVAIEVFEVPGTLGLSARIPVLSTQIYYATHPPGGGLPDYGMASVLGVMLLVLALILVYLYQRMTQNAEKFATVTGKGYRPQRIELGKWKLLIVLLVWIYVFVTVFLPFIILIWTSLHPFYMAPSLDALKKSSFEAYSLAVQHPGIGKTMWNTVLMSVLSGLITMILVTLIALMVVRGPISKQARRNLDTLSFLPQALPAMVIGLSLAFFYIRFPLPIYGTIWILIIGIVTKYLAFGSRAMISAQIQISSELEEASQISGASWLRTMRKIQLPILAPAILNCFIWVAVHAMRELSVVIMLYSPKTEVLSVTIWNMWNNGNTAEASVMGIFLILILGLLFFGGQFCVNRLARSR